MGTGTELTAIQRAQAELQRRQAPAQAASGGGMFEAARAELQRRQRLGSETPVDNGFIAADRAEDRDQREVGKMWDLPNGATLIATFDDNGRVYRGADGQLGAVNRSYSTTNQEDVQRILEGGGAEISGILRDSFQDQILDQNPVISRASEVAQGVPFAGSWLDEAVGRVSPQRQENMRVMSEAFQNRRPGEQMALNMAGGVAGSIPMAMAVGPTIAAAGPTSLAGRVGLGATGAGLAGAVEGGIYSAGTGETPQERTDLAQSGAIAGGVIGAGLGGLTPFASRALQGMLSRRNSDISTIRNTFGISAIAARQVKLAIDNGDHEGAIAAMVRAGDDAMLADSSIGARQVLDAAGQHGGPAATTVRNAIDGRVTRAATDLSETMDRYLGTPQGRQEMIDRIRVETAPERSRAYNAAYAATIDYSGEHGAAIEGIIQRVPESAWRRAEALMRLEGEETAQRLASVAEDGTVTLTQLPDVRTLDYVTRALNDVAREADGKGALGGTTDLGRATQAVSQNLRTTLRQAVPEYAEALETAATAIGRREAVDVGYDLLRATTRREDVARALNGSTGPERAEIRQGIRSYIDDTTANVRQIMSDPNIDAREALVALNSLRTRASREKIDILLGVRDGARLHDELDQIVTAFEMRAALAGNSKTAVRTAVHGGVQEGINGGILNSVLRIEPNTSVRRLGQAMSGATDEAMEIRSRGIYQEIAQALTQDRGRVALRHARVVQAAIDNQEVLSEGQSRAIAEYLGTIDGLLQTTAQRAISPDPARPRQSNGLRQ